jgi:hypothetical protein
MGRFDMDKLLSPAALTFLYKLIVGNEQDREGKPLGLQYGNHSQIEDLFGGSNLEIVPRASQGIGSRTRDTLNRANSTPSEHNGLKKLIENVADLRGYRNDPDRNARTVQCLNETLRPDGFELRMINGRWRLFTAASGQAVTEQLDKKIGALDFDSVKVDFERALSQADNDPEDAVTSACSLVESVCKCILEEMNVSLLSKQNIQHLSESLAKELNLSPARRDIEPDIKQILGGLQNVAAGIGALRTHSGDAHGRGRSQSRIDSRIARLAVHAASILALFYIETWQRHHGGKK